KDILKNQSSEYKTVIQKQFLINILDRKQLTNIQFELALNQNMRQCQVIQTNILTDQIKNVKILKEKIPISSVDVTTTINTQVTGIALNLSWTYFDGITTVSMATNNLGTSQ
ncbi:unnamed protein product, partial [Rotaria sp. Silwood1]